MAFNLDSQDDLGAMGGINVTPLVDVMLVLLIIFMITAPMLTQALNVQLPTAEEKIFETTASQPSTVVVRKSGEVSVDGVAISPQDLDVSLLTLLKGKQIKRALLEADQNVPYGVVVRVVDIMNRAGVEQLGMVTRPAEKPNAGSRR